MKPENARVEFCSGCMARTTHRSQVNPKKGRLRRRFRCQGCGATTSQCSVPGCRHMAIEVRPAAGARKSRAKPKWFCAEHGGEIPGFSKMDLRFSDLSDWNDFFARDSVDVRKLGKGILVALAVGGAVGGVASRQTEGLAASLGVMGQIGKASTGRAIRTLSGAALSKASLAKLGGGALAAGGGGMAVGKVVIGAGSAAAGTAAGAVLANDYFGEVKGYEITRLRRGRDHEQPPLLFINGFLQQEDELFDDWERGTRALFPGSAAYGVQWESGRLLKLTKDLPRIAAATARLAGKSGPARAAAGLAGANARLANSWFVALHKAQTVGELNAHMLSGFDGAPPVLMGHSLGARTIYYTLLQLAETGEPPKVQDVFLLGGAVGKAADWNRAAAAVAGSIWNLFSERDQVLSKLYRVGTAFSSNPVGLGPIKSDAANIVNVDCTDLVEKHREFKEKLGDLLQRSQRSAPNQWAAGSVNARLAVHGSESLDERDEEGAAENINARLAALEEKMRLVLQDLDRPITITLSLGR